VIELRDQYVTRFGSLAGTRVHAAAHDGEFRQGEVKRLGARAPSVYVACVGVPEAVDETGELQAELAWAAFVLTREGDAIRAGHGSAGDFAALLSLAIIHELERGEDFAAATRAARKVRAQNLFGTDVAREGYSLWAVTWQQATTITPEGLVAALSALRTVHTDMDLDPEQGVDVSATQTLDIDRDMSGGAGGSSSATGTLET